MTVLMDDTLSAIGRQPSVAYLPTTTRPKLMPCARMVPFRKQGNEQRGILNQS